MQHFQTLINSMVLSCVLEARLGYYPYFQLKSCSEHHFLGKAIATANHSSQMKTGDPKADCTKGNLLGKIPAKDYSHTRPKNSEREAHETPDATSNHLPALLVHQLLPPVRAVAATRQPLGTARC